MSSTLCPDIGILQALLEEGAGRDESPEVAAHLETCAGCRQTLETLAGDRDAWEDAARGLEKRVRQEPALGGLVQRLKRGELQAAEDDLFFLQPADKPGLLGMLGPYEVEEVVGRGGMGVVLRGRDPALNRTVALKVLAPHLAASATARRRFVREGRSAAAVYHEHIVTIDSVNEANGLPYLVMHYVAGESLQDRLDRAGPLEIAEIVRIGAQTAAGLAAAHAQQLIHRDIKPANLLLEQRGHKRLACEPTSEPLVATMQVKITDFGLARTADDVGLTQSGVVAGTPEYMAPEQARGEPIDARADLFSLGSVLYALCSGAPPFRGPTALAVIRKLNEEEPTPLRQLNPDVPAWLEAFIARLLAKDPAERFQSAAEVGTLLEGYTSHLRQPEIIAAPELPASPAPHQVQLAKSNRQTGLPAAGLANSFPCPECGRSLKIKAELAGRKVKCPACDRTILAGSAADIASSPPPKGPRRFTSFSNEWLWGLLACLLLLLGGAFVLWLPGSDSGPPGTRLSGQQRDEPPAPEGVPQKQYAQQFFQSFKGDAAATDGWNIFTQRPEGSVQVEPAGLRITLPPGGEDKMQSTGIGSHFGIKGDFEITLHFEILQDPDPADVGKTGTRLCLTLSLDTPLLGTPQEEAASLTRNMATKGFSAWIRCRHTSTSSQKVLPAPVMAGRLRMVRSGEELFYLASAGVDQPFELVQTYRFGAEEVQKIMICGQAGSKKVHLDLRVSDLLIRADAIPGAPAGPGESGRRWLLAGLLLALTVVVILALGVLLSRRGGA